MPAIAETVPGYEAVIWFGVGVSQETPADVVGKPNREINLALASPKIKSKLAERVMCVIKFEGSALRRGGPCARPRCRGCGP